MNKDNAKDYLPLVQALAEGKTIQYNSLDTGWMEPIDISFSRTPENYRIKPEPLECWVFKSINDGTLYTGFPHDFKPSYNPVGFTVVKMREVTDE